MNEGMIKEAIDALAAKNRTVKGWDGKVSLCDLGYCMAGIDEGWEGCGQCRSTRAAPREGRRSFL